MILFPLMTAWIWLQVATTSPLYLGRPLERSRAMKPHLTKPPVSFDGD